MRRRLVALAAVLVVTGGGLVVAQQVPPAVATDVAGRTTRAGTPAQMSLPATGLAAVPVCPGPQTLVVPAGGLPVGPGGPVVVGAVVEGSVESPAAQAKLADRVLRTSGGSFGLLTLPLTSAGPVPLRVARSAAAPPMSAVQLGLTRTGDVRGVSALSCATASTQAWLVGGGTRAGRRGQLVLTNPAVTPAKVDVTVHGPAGAVENLSGHGVVVPARGQMALRIDALAPELDAVAVHVQARSGRVSASLRDSYLHGVTPSGVDDVPAAAPAATRQVIPGISIAPAAGTTLPRSATVPGAVAVRVVNPGASELIARVTLLGEMGEVVLPGGVLSVGAGSVRDLPITAVPAGVYSAVVEGDAPVVTGAIVGRALAGGQIAGTVAAVGHNVPPAEFGWAGSVEPLAGATLVALPALIENGRRAGVSAVLSVAAPGTAGSVEVIELDVAGKALGTSTVLAPAGSGAQKAISREAVAVRLRPVPGSGPLMAALVLTVDDTAGPMVAVLPVRPGPTGSGARPHVVSDARVGMRLPLVS